ncbi:hypothetical protein U0070_000686 [Myodes glareolus]|uniref:Uncharacterized protein n=1 Tax=Myodes glareolus TaxID=447135 RepID=A0AAW0IH91_MYOGA
MRRQQSQPQSSQPDYSKAWEDYYKKSESCTPTLSLPHTLSEEARYGQGLLVALSSQFGGHTTSAAPQASSPPDYTMAWAEYYRQQAAFYGQTLGQAQAHSQRIEFDVEKLNSESHSGRGRAGQEGISADDAATLLFAVDSDQTEAHHSTLAVPVFLHPFWHLSLHTEYTSQALQYVVD